MSRTILTSATVFITLLAMYIFGGSSIRGFNYCMLIGVISGTYSTVAIAAPLLILRIERERQRARVAAPAPA
jgi:SecD/SecF fusion protein